MTEQINNKPLSQKLLDGDELTEKERTAAAQAVKFALNALYQKGNIPFICGEIGPVKEDSGMPEYYLICPAYGCGWGARYKLVDTYLTEGS